MKYDAMPILVYSLVIIVELFYLIEIIVACASDV